MAPQGLFEDGVIEDSMFGIIIITGQEE